MVGAQPSTLGSEALAARAARHYSTFMSDERALAAIDRIERALARIEAAAERPPPAPRDDGALRQLREVHEALRGRVEAAIGQIDGLLATAERG
jgi:hypothetical protein